MERSGDLTYPTVVTLENGGTASPGDIVLIAATSGGTFAASPW
ncbi:hypothetical protein FHS88_003502 [Roseomonas alkaliterrae]|uniref:Uncharacterized protein n=1 Tax=Neoroseomonas alkaliterrae TaxID=1452450 RepID=A0A840XXM1_9PROT|nr:hypothetical protein [Neoroseomonas alkaliterrae]MBB5691349.1 hypothetical protein [Neoroseomonas alkaliterrae]